MTTGKEIRVIRTMSEGTVTPEFVNALLFPLQNAGLDVAAFLAEHDIELPLDGDGVAGAVSQADYNRVVLAVLRHLQDESGGAAPVRTPFGTSRMLIYAVMSCGNLEQAMRRAIEFNFSCVEPRNRQVRLELNVDEDQRTASLEHFREAAADGSPVSQEILLCNMAMWLRICSWLVGRQIEVVRADCAQAEPSYSGAVRHFLRCPVYYGKDSNRLYFGAALLDLPIVRTEADLEQFLRNAPYQVVVGGNIGAESIVARIRRALENCGDSLPSFEDLAGQLHMSVRTLRRRLDDEGISYQQIKDDVRRDTACGLLTGTGKSVSDIADEVGFSDASAFHRSFRKWTGMAPGEYRSHFGNQAAN
jgi:AraC-like DNA-binding protein